MDQDIFAKLQGLVCILHGQNRLYNQDNYVHNYMAHKEIPIPESNLVLFLNHQSSQCIEESSSKL